MEHIVPICECDHMFAWHTFFPEGTDKFEMGPCTFSECTCKCFVKDEGKTTVINKTLWSWDRNPSA